MSMKSATLAAIFVMTAALALGACAHPALVSPPPAPPPAPAPAPRAKPVEVTWRSADESALEKLERRLERARPGERVAVPARLLRALLSHERQLRNRCDALSGQLEALKNVDLEEIHEGEAHEDLDTDH
jgi:hypothetical protein